MASEAQTRSFGPAGRFELQPRQRRLVVDGQPAVLGARAFDLLLALTERPGDLWTKNELIDKVWPDVVVEEGNLAAQISALRKVLGSDLIATIPGRGYRFAAHVEPLGTSSPTVAAALPVTPAVVPALVSSASLALSEATLRTNLPVELPQLIGRADDLAALHRLVEQHRLVSIVGAGGMGKTSLAQACLHARREAYAHGVCWVDLAPLTDPAAIASTIAMALGLVIGQGDPLQRLCGVMAPLRILVAFDNAEHLLEGTAQVARALLDSAPGVRLLATTQAPLKLAAESVFRLDVLGVPQGPLPAREALAFGSVALFAERARLADTRFALTDTNTPAVIDLCRQLDGLPLAIELAAARAPMLGVHKLAASMQDRLRLLGAGRNRAAPARQQTLRSALEWSHGFLDSRERTVFRRLAIFAGSGSLAMVRRIVSDAEGELDEWAVLEALSALVDRSLVVALTANDALEPRYRLLESARLFALEQLRLAGEYDVFACRHAQAFAERFDTAWDEFWDGRTDRADWRQAMAAEVDNGWQAFAWARAAGDKANALRVAATLLRALWRSGSDRVVSLREQCEPWLEDLDDADLRAQATHSVAMQFGGVSKHRAALLLRGALDGISMQPETPRRRWLRYLLLGQQCAVLAKLGELEAARAALQAAARCEDNTWPPLRRAVGAEGAANLAAMCGDTHEAIRQGRRELTLNQAGGDGEVVSASLADLIDFQLAAGDAQAAARSGTQLVASLACGRDQSSLVHARLNLGAAWLSLDEIAQARTVLRDGWTQAPVFTLSFAYANYLALLAALESRPHASARLAGYADAGIAPDAPRGPNQAAAIERATRLACAELGDDGFASLHAEGTMLSEPDIAAIAFATDDGL